jgi:hypothetical protein
MIPISLEGRSTNSLMGISFFLTESNQLKVTEDVSDDAKLLLSYFSLPLPFADETDLDKETEIPDVHIDTVIWGVAARAFDKRRDFADGERAQLRFLRGIQDAIRFESIKTGPKRRVIVQ